MEKANIKKYIKSILGERITCKIKNSKRLYKNVYANHKFGKIKSLLKSKSYYNKCKALEIKKILSNVKLTDVSKEENFYYSIDPYIRLCTNKYVFGNFSLDYSKILDKSLNDYKNILEQNKKEENFYKNEMYVIEGLEIQIDRIIKKIEKQNCHNDIINNLKNIKDKKAEHFQEALQRILFLNQQLWQVNHELNGLGRLDMLLIKYYKNDIDNKVLTREKAKQLIEEFLLILHRYYRLKSTTLMGDTGQIIEIGGKDIDGEYQYNELTYIFIEAMEKLKLPEPKVLLRVSKDMPRSLMEKSLRCIQTGIGCPLFSNDDVIIDKLIEFGYKKEEAYNYCTSACWEPYIVGKSTDNNNINYICFMEPFQKLLENEDLNKISNISELLKIYKKYLKNYIKDIINNVNKIEFEKAPLLSLFIDGCIEKNKDIAEGGAIYNDYGLTTVSLANFINSLVNIEEIVFNKKEMTFKELDEIRRNNFNNNENIMQQLKNQTKQYGTDNEEIIQVVNDIIEYTTEVLKNERNPFNGRYKFGLSSPNYILASENFPASFDGRKDGEPFSVHISSNMANGYTELMQFASKLDYKENRFNGNVVDFFASPNFINDNFDKFVDFLMLSIKNGFFQMQMNVVSSKVLIEARKNPDKFPNLIVRVWGFSSYFKDLPDEYKDYLIERAIKSEGNS